MSWKLPTAYQHLAGPGSLTVEPGGFALPHRLFSLLGAVPRRPRLLDVGADHGLLALAALRLGVADEVLAIDRREGPLAGAAARNFVREGESFAFKLSDGLDAVDATEDDCVVIAGMSGENAASVMRSALARGNMPDLWCFQVNDGHAALRQACYASGFRPVTEWFVAEPKRFFLNQIWMNCGSSDFPPSPIDLELGPLSYSGLSPLMEAWIAVERARVTRDLEGLRKARGFDACSSDFLHLTSRLQLLERQSLVIPGHTD